MKDERIEDRYFTWLYSQTGSVNVKDPARTHWNLLRFLHNKEFVWFIGNDDNRAETSKELRLEFVRDLDYGFAEVDESWFNLGCSMLELIVGLSRDLAFTAGGEPYVWFWELLENLKLKEYTDKREISEEHVSDVLDEVIWRTYSSNGVGGLFPLKRPQGDQREIELWYQLQAYVLERE